VTERILLIGMMGAGKSTVGKTLASRLQWRYLDSDEQVEAMTGKTVPEIFASEGEAAFRFQEALALTKAIALEEPVIIGVAGGAVLDLENRRLIKEAGEVVWLRADPDVLSRRVGSGKGRPLLGDDPRAAIHRLYVERRPVYEELADIVVDTDTLDADQVAAEIVAAHQNR
jgi:shikimate kinase